MKFNKKNPPRTFAVENNKKFYIKDCGDVFLDENEQVTFKNNNTTEYDVVRKKWGYYASPSLNGRLIHFNLRACLIRNTKTNRYFILMVEKTYEDDFQKYLDDESCEIVSWLDDTKKLDKIKNLLSE